MGSTCCLTRQDDAFAETRPGRVGRALLYVSIRSCTPHDPTPCLHAPALIRPRIGRRNRSKRCCSCRTATSPRRRDRPGHLPSSQSTRSQAGGGQHELALLRPSRLHPACGHETLVHHARLAPSPRTLALPPSPARSSPRPPHTRSSTIYADAYALVSTLLAPSAPTSSRSSVLGLGSCTPCPSPHPPYVSFSLTASSVHGGGTPSTSFSDTPLHLPHATHCKSGAGLCLCYPPSPIGAFQPRPRRRRLAVDASCIRAVAKTADACVMLSSALESHLPPLYHSQPPGHTCRQGDANHTNVISSGHT